MPNDTEPENLPLVHPDNALGSPLTSAVGAVAALILQGVIGGFVVPHDVMGCLNIALSVAVFVLGLLLKSPGK